MDPMPNPMDHFGFDVPPPPPTYSQLTAGDTTPNAKPKPDAIVDPYEPVTSDDGDKGSRAGEEADLVTKLDRQWQEARVWMGPAHTEARDTRDFYDGMQWDENQRSALRRDGKPDLVINLMAKAIDNLMGRERASRYDWKAAPVGEDDVLAADAMTHGLKYVTNQDDVNYTISEAFEDALLGPLGVLEVIYDDTDADKEPLSVDRVDPFEWFFDPHSRHRGLKDCRYTIRVRVLDLDIAKATWPDKADDLETAQMLESLRDKESVMSDYDNTDDGRPYEGVKDGVAGDALGRDLVLVREHQYWVLEEAEWMRMPDGRAYDWDESQPGRMYQLHAQGGERMKGRKRVFYIANVANQVLLDFRKSPYPYDRFSYVPLWCKRDRKGRPRGLAHSMVDAQKEVNVNLARANESLRSRHLLYEPGALGSTTSDQAAKQLSSANFVMEVADLNRVKLGTDAADADMFVKLMELAEKHIDDIIGNNEASYGDNGNEKSGVAIQARVMQQSMTMGKVFDNLKFARLYIGEMLIALMQKFYSPQKMTRIIHAQVLQASGAGVTPGGAPKGQMPDLTWLNQTLSGPIFQMRFDVQLEDVGESITERQAQMQQMTEVLGMLPEEMKMQFLPDMIRASDWAGAEAMAGKIEQAMQQQSQQGQTPNVKDYLQANFKDMPAAAQQAWLQTVGLPTDLTPNPTQQQSLASKVPQAPGPAQPPPLNPNTLLQEQVKLAGIHAKQQEASIARTHDELKQARDHQHQAGMAQLQAQLTPPPSPSGGGFV